MTIMMFHAISTPFVRFRPLALAVVALHLGTMQPVSASSPPRLELRAQLSLTDNTPEKTVKAFCPAGKFVVGGGAEIRETSLRIRLTGLRPVHNQRQEPPPRPTAPDYFEARAATPSLLPGPTWTLVSYAICAPREDLEDYHIAQSPFGPFGGVADTFQTASASCGDGTVAYGSGASLHDQGADEGRVGLQTVRTSGPLDISRAAARADDPFYSGKWSLFSYAICARPRGGIHSVPVLEQGRVAVTDCDSGFVHGPGGGAGLVDSGTFLHDIVPSANLKGLIVAMTEPPTDNQTSAHFTCAE